MCQPLLQYLNGKFHARHSVRHITETDYAARELAEFSLTEVEATKDPHQGRLGHPRDHTRRRDGERR